MNLSTLKNNFKKHNISSHISKVILASIFILSLFCLPKLIEFSNYTLTILSYPYIWALTENENMLFIHQIASAKPFYTLMDTDSFTYFVYPPFFHLITAFFIKVFGFSIFIPRLLSVLSFLTLTVLLGLFFKDKKRTIENIFVSIILIAASVSIPFYSMYYPLARVDMSAYAFAFLSLYFLWKIIYIGQENTKYYFFAGLFALFALFTKQAVFFPYIIVAILFVFSKNKKTWLLFGSCLGLATVFCFFILQWYTQGDFLRSMLLAREIYGKYLMSAQHFYWLQDSFISHYIGFIIGGLGLLLISLYQWYRNRQFFSFSVIIMAAIYINFVITGGNSGAAYNTVIPVVFGLLLMLKELYFIDVAKNVRSVLQVLFIGIVIWQVSVYTQFSTPYVIPSQHDRKNQKLLIQTLKNSSTPWVLGDRVDYATLAATKFSPLEASTHNVARDWSTTKEYAAYVEQQLLYRLNHKKITTAVLTITNFGKGKLYTYINQKGKLIKTIPISYMDAANLDHKIYTMQ